MGRRGPQNHLHPRRAGHVRAGRRHQHRRQPRRGRWLVGHRRPNRARRGAGGVCERGGRPVCKHGAGHRRWQQQRAGGGAELWLARRHAAPDEFFRKAGGRNASAGAHRRGARQLPGPHQRGHCGGVAPAVQPRKRRLRAAVRARGGHRGRTQLHGGGGRRQRGVCDGRRIAEHHVLPVRGGVPHGESVRRGRERHAVLQRLQRPARGVRRERHARRLLHRSNRDRVCRQRAMQRHRVASGE